MENKQIPHYEEEIELKELVSILVRNKKIIAVITGCIVVLALLFSIGRNLYAPAIVHSVANAEIRVNENEEFKTQLKTVAALGDSPAILEAVKSQLKLTMDISEMKNAASVSIKQESKIVVLSYQHVEGTQAIKIVDAMANQVVSYTKGSMSVGSIQVTKPGALTPEKITIRKPINIELNTIIGLVLGLIFSVFFIFAKEYLNKKVKTVSDLERSLGLKVIGVLPNVKE